MSKISKSSKLVIQLLLLDPAIRSQILLEGDLPKSARVNDDGSVTFGRKKYMWWSELFNATYTISFTELSVKIINILGGVGNNKHPIVDSGLKSEFLDSVFGGDKNKMIDSWLFTYKLSFESRNDNTKEPYITQGNLDNAAIKLSSNFVGVPIWVRDSRGELVQVIFTNEDIKNLNKTVR